MMELGYHKINLIKYFLFIILLSLFLLIAGCNGGSGGGDDDSGEEEQEEEEAPDLGQWYMHEVKHLDAEGLLVPRVTAQLGNDGDVRIAYFSDGTDFWNGSYNENRYNINFLIWDFDAYENTGEIVTEEVLDPVPPEAGGEGLDNCNPLAMDLGNLDYPIIAYQGGYGRDQGPDAERQSDVMFSISVGQGWEEYMGAMGYVPAWRGFLPDGLAGSDLSVAIDSQGYIHICYQFYYEGMDAMNFHPDLNYVRHNGNSLNNPIQWDDIEETVYGNYYNDTHTMQILRNVGFNCKLLLDDSDNPVVFFVENTDISGNEAYGLWFARRESNGVWTRQWVEEVDLGWTIGDLSAAKDPDGNFAVAYSKVCLDCDEDEGDHLKYAAQSGNSWNVQVVDDSSICGHSPSLAFDSEGNPAIAYYDLESHSGHSREYLRLTEFNGFTWTSEIVTEDNDFGHHNSLWFDSNDRPFICSYSEAVDDIVIFERH